MLASPQTSFGVRLSRIEPQRRLSCGEASRMQDFRKTGAGMPDQDSKFQKLSSGDGEKKNAADDKLTFRLNVYWHIY